MGTRGIIGTADDGSFKGRYVGMDSYPSWTLDELLKAYRKLGSAQAVIDFALKPDGDGYWGNFAADAVEPNGEWRESKGEGWVTDTDDVGAEWAYLLDDRGINVVAAMRANGEKAIGMFGSIGDIIWQSAGRIDWDAQEVDYAKLECGENYERCIHYAFAHFPEAADTRVGTAVWLGRRQPGRNDLVAVEQHGIRYQLGGSGGTGSTHSSRYDPGATTRYWWQSIVLPNGDQVKVRLFRIIRAGCKLEKGYTGIVVTAAGEIRIPAGTVLA